MTAVLETRIEGSPDAIAAVATYLKNTVAASAEILAADVGSARRTTLDGWSGTAADAFGSTAHTATRAVTAFGDEVAELPGPVNTLADALRDAQQTMTDARSTASANELTVNGTQIHEPGAAPAVQRESEAPYEQTEASRAAITAHNGKVDVWNDLVTTVGDARDRWNEALQTFASVWGGAAGNLASVVTGLVTTGVSAAALANTAYQLKGVKLLNADRVASAQRALADAVKDGRVLLPKDQVYTLMDDAARARAAITDADDALTKSLKVGSKLSRGLLVLGIAGTAYGIYDDMQNGESGAQAVASNAGGFAAGMGAGALAGVGAGAIVGSFIVPPAGTIAGVVVGGIVGGAVGLFTSGAIDHLFEDASAGFVDTLSAGWDEVASTGQAIGDLATGAWHAIFG